MRNSAFQSEAMERAQQIEFAHCAAHPDEYFAIPETHR
jgi:hypothetical protein